ncbi:MAG: tetratricopeptide repeat protein, partial [Bacteroidetes bacterium]|nr:tetratricopeptide repeat protein [Bacteroidota bacterium]
MLKRPIHKRLPIKQALKYEAFLQDLNHYENGESCQAILSVNTTVLGDEIVQDITERELGVEVRFGLENVQSIPRFFREDSNKSNFIIWPFYKNSELNEVELAAQLVFHRDDIIRRSHKLIFIFSSNQFYELHKSAYDFVFTAQTTLELEDKSGIVESDLMRSPEVTEPEQNYLNEKTELEQSRNENITGKKLQKKLFQVAFAAYKVSKIDESLQLYLEALDLARENVDKEYEALILGNIGVIYSDKGELDEALKYHKSALELHRQIGYVQGEANQLGNIGLIYSNKGELDEALKYHKSAL